MNRDRLHPAYFDVRFRGNAPFDGGWPDEFAIITAYATTGEVWKEAENEAADAELERVLRGRGIWLRRLTGYSPVSGHAERGWAVDLGFTDACDIARAFKQDAIYFVRGDTLYASFADERRAEVLVGAFRERLTA